MSRLYSRTVKAFGECAGIYQVRGSRESLARLSCDVHPQIYLRRLLDRSTFIMPLYHDEFWTAPFWCRPNLSLPAYVSQHRGRNPITIRYLVNHGRGVVFSHETNRRGSPDRQGITIHSSPIRYGSSPNNFYPILPGLHFAYSWGKVDVR